MLTAKQWAYTIAPFNEVCRCSADDVMVRMHEQGNRRSQTSPEVCNRTLP